MSKLIHHSLVAFALLCVVVGTIITATARANALPTVPHPPTSGTSTWEAIHTGEAKYVCDKVLKKHPKHKRNRYKYVNCHVVWQ